MTPRRSPLKIYLGDGAYAEAGSYAGEIVLTTSDGLTDTNRIVLGPTELATLATFIKIVNEQEPRS